MDFSLSPYINASYQLNLSESLFRLCIQTDFFYSLPAKTIRARILNHMKDYLKVTELENLVILAIDVAEIPETSDSKEYNFKYTSFLGLNITTLMHKDIRVHLVWFRCMVLSTSCS